MGRSYGRTGIKDGRTAVPEYQDESEDGTTDEIVSTPGHKYYLPLNRANRNPEEEMEHASYEGLTEQWVSASDLKAGDRVVLAQTEGLTEKVKYGIVKAVKTEESESYTTYNFEVEDYHDELEGDSNSIVHQREILSEYARKHGFENIRFYADDGYSGTNFDRPDFQRMMADAQAGLIKTIIVKDMSRFGRDYIMVGYYTEILLPQADIRFIAVNDGVDTDNQADNDFTPFRNIINEWYAKDTSKKIRSVLKAKGNAGKHLSVIPPFGYQKDPNDKEKWIIDEEAAQIVKKIFRMYLDCHIFLWILNY